MKTINGGMRHTLFTHMVPMCVCFKCTYILSKVSLHPEMEERISSVSRERESVKKGGEKGERGSRAIVVAQLLPSCFCSMSVHSHHDFGWWGFFLPLCFLLNFGYRCYCKSSMTKPQRKKKLFYTGYVSKAAAVFLCLFSTSVVHVKTVADPAAPDGQASFLSLSL